MDDETFFKVERIVQEYNTIKQVLINNAIPVDLAHIASGGTHKGQQKNSKGWGMRVLFDKKVFQYTLVELEQMRKLYSVKKQFYLFHLPYFGKPKKMTPWYRKVEARTTQTLKFVNLARILRIIQYDPAQYMSMHKLNQMTSSAGIEVGPGEKAGPRDSLQSAISLSGESYRNSLIEQTRKSNIGSNLFQILSKYNKAGSFLRSITDIVRKVNSNGSGSVSRFEP